MGQDAHEEDRERVTPDDAHGGDEAAGADSADPGGVQPVPPPAPLPAFVFGERAEARLRLVSRWLVRLITVAVLALGGIAGAAVALRLDGPHLHRTSIATFDVSVRAAVDGRVELFVPLVDWRVTTDPYHAPVAIDIEARALDRGAAKDALTPAGARAQLSTLRVESRDVLADAVKRAVVVSIVGGLIGGVLTGAIVALVRLRRRMVAYGAVIGCVTVVASSLLAASAIGRFDEGELTNPSYEGRAAELPRLLAFSQQLLYAGRDYQRLYSRALSSLDNLQTFTAQSDRVGTRTYLVASDIHNNEFVLPAFDRFAGSRTVFLVGDFGQIGSRLEQRIVPLIARVGGRAIAVSGNHDTSGLMDQLANDGVTVLDRDHGAGADADPDAVLAGENGEKSELGAPGDVDAAGEGGPVPLRVDGLRVLGYDDPLMGRDEQPHVLRVYGKRYEQQAADLISWYDALETKPEVLLVHQHGLAKRLLRHLDRTAPAAPRLVVLTGHDHVAKVEHIGSHVLVDAGTLGAGGPFAVGEQDATFAQLSVRGGRLIGVDIVTIDPVSGDASSEHTAV